MKNFNAHIVIAITLALVTASLSACRVVPPDLSGIEVGMSKSDVIKTMGKPNDFKGIGRSVYFIYHAEGEDLGLITWNSRYIKITDGKVESYGRWGDFDTTKDPTLNVNVK
jgi:hypothetical protein